MIRRLHFEGENNVRLTDMYFVPSDFGAVH